MTCPHCGAEVRQQERFCPACSRLVDSPLLKIRQELDAARAAMLRDRPAPLARSLAKPAAPATVPPAAARAATTGPPRGKHEKRKAEIRARLAAQGVPPPPPPPREVHSAAKHELVPDDTLQQALRGQGAQASAVLEQARQQSRAAQAAATRPPQPQPADRQGQKKPKTKGQAPSPAAAAGRDRAEATPPRRTTAAIAVLVLFNLAVLATLYAGLQWFAAMPDGSLGQSAAEGVRVGTYVLGGTIALATLGLFALQPFGRALQRFTSVFWLPVYPFGTLFAFVTYLHLGSRGVRLLFSGRPATHLNATEAALMARSRKFAPLMAIVLFVLGGMAWGNLLSLAHDLEPRLRQPGSVAGLFGAGTAEAPAEPADPREAMLSDLENFAIKQAAYAHANGGLFDRTECLVSNTCIAGQAPLAAPLEARYLEPVRFGYEFRLRLGPPPDTREAGTSATSVTSFTYLALPTGDSADPSGYCIERGLTICRFPAGVPITSPPGECPADCEFVR